MEYLELDYTDIQQTVEELLSNEVPISFGDFVKLLVSGDVDGIGNILKEYGFWLISRVTLPVKSGMQLLIILLLAALFTNVSKAFTKNGVSRIGFLCAYLLMTVYAATGFHASFKIVEEGIESLCRFIEILIPTYCISIAFVSGSITASGYYQGTVFIIGALQFAVRYLFLPMSQAYLLIAFASCMQKKPIFTKLLELIETVYSWAQKTLIGLVIAMGSIQGFLLPAIDKLKRNAVIKTAGAIPGVGSVLEGAWETVLGAGVVLKNAVGIGGVLLIFFLGSIPLITVGMQYLMYRILAAVAEPITEDTLEQFLAHAAVAHRLLFQVLFLALLLFLLLLVVMTRISA